MSAALDLPPYAFGDAVALERELGVSHPVAQILARRRLAEPAAARAWLRADEHHPPSAWPGLAEGAALVARHVRAGTRVTVHGDYDVDGVCATALLVRALRSLGADVDWVLPSRLEDGYGLALATVERLAAHGTRLLVTVDCAVTAVEEVAAARALGLDVLVTDHHAPRADGALPDAPLVHPAVAGYPCPELCAAGVAHKLVEALGAELDGPPGLADRDLELVALATVCDVVPLRGENRRLVRAGLKALGATRSPGLRALLGVAQVDPGRVDAGALGFRLGPRLNAAGRLARADAGVELLLTEDAERAQAIAQELDHANAERRAVEERIRWAAEAQVAEQGEQPAYVLAGEDWHPGVVGIVASRIAERHHRPAVLLAPDPKSPGGWTGSGRSIPGFDLLEALHGCAGVLGRYGGHRAAAGVALAGEDVAGFRAAFTAEVEAGLTPELLERRERVDAVVSGAELGLELAEELEALGPFGHGNPEPVLLVPAARCGDRRPMGEDKHLRFSLEAGGVRARGVAFGAGAAGARRDALAVADDETCDVTVRLEVNDWQGAVEPRLVLRGARRCGPAPITVAGEPGEEEWLAWVLAPAEPPAAPVAAEPSAQPLTDDPAAALSAGPRAARDVRGLGTAAVLAELTATGEPVLAVVADVPRRRPGLAERVGGFTLCSWGALARDPSLAAAYPHVVALDPPAGSPPPVLGGPWLHLAWGEDELRFSLGVLELEHDLRPALAGLFRALRARGRVAGDDARRLLQGDGAHPRSPAHAGRLVRVLCELGLARVERDPLALVLAGEERTALERSPTYRAAAAALAEGRRCLSRRTSRKAA